MVVFTMSSDFFKENRKAAARAGRVRFMGAPCVKQEHVGGNGSERYVLTGRCVVCQKDNVKSYAQKQAEKWRSMRGDT
jgi:hypothetical protein